MTQLLSLSRDLRPYFFCLAKRNRGKKRLPPAACFLRCFVKLGGCGTRPNSPQNTWAVAVLIRPQGSSPTSLSAEALSRL